MSATLEPIVRRCLAKHSSQRFPTMADVKAALERAVLAPPQETPSIAVLPFANMSSDPENEFFGDGLAEEILNALVAIEGLRVAARTSSTSFKGRQAAILTTSARRLSVRHVLEGSVRKAGNRVRVTVSRIRLERISHLVGAVRHRQLADIFDVQDEIARSIVLRLKVALGGDARLVTAPTSNMEAYELYLRGRAMFVQARNLGCPSSRELPARVGARRRIRPGVGGCCRRAGATVLWRLCAPPEIRCRRHRRPRRAR